MLGLNNLYALRGDIVLRREYYGLMVFDPNTHTYRHYNPDALELMKYLQRPFTICALKSANTKISWLTLMKLIADLKNNNIIKQVDRDYLAGRILYLDREQFRSDCLITPGTVTSYITEGCGKHCRHCVTRAGKALPDELSVEQNIAVIQSLVAAGVCSWIVSGGEPLSKQGIFEILQEADKLPLSISLLTDYDGLDEKCVSQLKTLRKLNCLQLSLDGGTEETQDYMRGKGAFQNALRRFELLQNSGIPYTIAVSVNRLNISELPHITDIYHKYGASSLFLNPLAPYGRGEELTELLLTEEQLYWLGVEYVRLIREEGVRAGNRFWDQYADNHIPISRDFFPFKDALGAFSTGAFALAIDSQGNCYPDSKLKSLGSFKLGNILQNSMEEIWYNPILDKLRSHFNSGNPFVDESQIL